MPARQSIPEWTSDYVGLDYLEYGRSREGLDCYGLVRLVLAERAGINLPALEHLGYTKGMDKAALGRVVLEYQSATDWQAVPPSKARLFDIAWLRTVGAPIHFGLVLAPTWMLHIEEGTNSVIEQYTNSRWARRLVEILRHVG